MGFLSDVGGGLINAGKKYIGMNTGNVVTDLFNVYSGLTKRGSKTFTNVYSEANLYSTEYANPDERNKGFRKANKISLVNENDSKVKVLNDLATFDNLNENNYSLSIPDYGYDIWLNERYMFQRGLGNFFGEPGYFYYRIFFNFNTEHGLFGGIMNGKDMSATHNGAYKYMTILNSTQRYDSILIEQRMKSLERFTRTLSYISTNAPWFFKSVKGLDKVANPVLNEFSKEKSIEIECNVDAIDMRLSNLMDLYKFAVYDDMFKREVLPENMRQFDMAIMIFPSPVTRLHMPIADVNKTIPFASTQEGNFMSFKLFEFIDCEIDPQTIGIMVPGDINNEEPFQLGKGSIKINYRQCYQHTSNEFDNILWGSDGIFYEYTNSILGLNTMYGTESRIDALNSTSKSAVNHFGNLLLDYAKNNVSKSINKNLGKLLGKTWKNLTSLGYLSGYDKYGPGSKNWQDKVNRLSSKYIHTFTTPPTSNNVNTNVPNTVNNLFNNLTKFMITKRNI